MTAPPVARVDDQVSNRPGVIVDEQILEVADLTVGCFDMVADDRVAAAQMAIIRCGCRVRSMYFQFLFDPAFGGQAARVRAHAPQSCAAPVVRITVAPEVLGL